VRTDRSQVDANVFDAPSPDRQVKLELPEPPSVLTWLQENVEVQNGIGRELNTFADEFDDIVVPCDEPWEFVCSFKLAVIGQIRQVCSHLA
jgi:hypothetical protein